MRMQIREFDLPLAILRSVMDRTGDSACLLTCRYSKDEEVDVTLRITREKGTSSQATLRLEGSVVTEWAALLERECSDLLRSSGAVSLDLTAVNFVDRAGVEALVRLSRAGVEIRCLWGSVAGVLEAEGVRTQEADSFDRERS